MSGHEPTVIRPAAPSPLVVSVPHAGTLIPDAELHRYALSSEVLAADVDLFVDRLYAEAPALGATLISTPVSRFVVDLGNEAGPKPSGPKAPTIWDRFSV